jgi:uncharacterized membrane protein YqjE
MSAPVPGPGVDRNDLPYPGTEAFPYRDQYVAQQHTDDWDGARDAHERAARAEMDEASFGELFGRLTGEMSDLLRGEMELARVELKEEAAKAGKAGGMLGAAAAIGYVALILLAFAAAWGLAEVIATGWAFLVVGVVVAVIAGALAMTGRKKMREVNPVPEQTIENLKEDARWARARVT